MQAGNLLVFPVWGSCVIPVTRTAIAGPGMLRAPGYTRENGYNDPMGIIPAGKRGRVFRPAW